MSVISPSPPSAQPLLPGPVGLCWGLTTRDHNAGAADRQQRAHGRCGRDSTVGLAVALQDVEAPGSG